MGSVVRLRTLVALTLLLLGTAGLRAQGQASVSVKGMIGEGRDGPAYSLRVAGEISMPFDAVLVYAEPSHTLLAAHVNLGGADPARLLLKADLMRAFAVSAAHGPFTSSLQIPYRPAATEQRVSVWLENGSSELLLADARVNLRRFEFSTQVTLDPDATSAGIYNHCCSGGMCPVSCTECGTPYFSCDLITCDDVQCID